MKKLTCKIGIILLVLVVCMAPFSVFAAVPLDKTGSITISVQDRETHEHIGEAVFRIYKIADVFTAGEGVRFAYTDEFKDNGMAMGDLTDAYLPVHLMIYAVDNHLPYEERTSDSNDVVLFDNLSCGAYLVIPVSIQNGYINPTPFIAPIPVRNQSLDEWLYDLEPTPKTQIDGNTGEKTYIAAKKLWEGNKKPDSISVSLVKDGKKVETVSLNAKNKWSYKWENLDKNHAWHVIENDVPDGYEVKYSTSKNTVTITNKSTTPDKPTTTKPDQLTQTGQLNWPIPILLIAGMLLILLGWVLLNQGKNSEEHV